MLPFLLFLASFISSPMFVFAQQRAEVEFLRIGWLLSSLLGVFDKLIVLAVAGAFIFFFYGVATFILSDGESGKKLAEAKNKLLWGVIAIFVLTTLWGIVFFLEILILGGEKGNTEIQTFRVPEGVRSPIPIRPTPIRPKPETPTEDCGPEKKYGPCAEPETTPIPTQQQPTPTQQQPTPAEDCGPESRYGPCAGPAQQQPTPAQQQPTPAQQQPTPAQQQPTPAQQQPTPAQQQPTPAQQQPTPAQQQPTPAQQQPTPAEIHKQFIRNCRYRGGTVVWGFGDIPSCDYPTNVQGFIKNCENRGGTVFWGGGDVPSCEYPDGPSGPFE